MQGKPYCVMCLNPMDIEWGELQLCRDCSNNLNDGKVWRGVGSKMRTFNMDGFKVSLVVIADDNPDDLAEGVDENE